MEKPKLIKDLGMKYPTPNCKQKAHYGLFLCDCGKEFITTMSFVKTGHTKSCGTCIDFKITHGLSKTRIYKIWMGIKARCCNVKDTAYARYGGSGIKICDEWKNDFISFYNWAMDNGYSDKLEIDRINNNGNYEPSNCRWVDNFINQQNTRLIRKTNLSGYRGVNKVNNNWRSKITSNGIVYSLGYYHTPELAAIAYNNWVIEHKTNHPLNVIP